MVGILRVVRRRRNFRLSLSFLPTAVLLLILAVSVFLLVFGESLRGGSPTPKAPVIEILTPSFGPVGTAVTIRGSGFMRTENTILFAPQDGMAGFIFGLSSSDGRTLKFTVPEGLDLCPRYAEDKKIPCPQVYLQVGGGDYQVRVQNSAGESNAAIFVVTD